MLARNSITINSLFSFQDTAALISSQKSDLNIQLLLSAEIQLLNEAGSGPKWTRLIDVVMCPRHITSIEIRVINPYLSETAQIYLNHFIEWAQVDSNHRPLDYQSNALAS